MRQTARNDHQTRTEKASVGYTLGLAILFALVHSALASRQMKEFASRLFGDRYRNGLYRLLYSILAYLMFIWATIAFYRLPDRTLYQVPAPFSWLMRFGQLASFLMVLECIRIMGLYRGFGIEPLVALVRGRFPEPEPEGQGPRLGQNDDLLITGPYRHSRHPVNLAAFGIVWFHPRMTVNWLTIALFASLYALVGSLHEESRLQRIYGDRYARYQRTVPFMFPHVGGKRLVSSLLGMRRESRS